jgi:hypothetical protein
LVAIVVASAALTTLRPSRTAMRAANNSRSRETRNENYASDSVAFAWRICELR